MTTEDELFFGYRNTPPDVRIATRAERDRDRARDRKRAERARYLDRGLTAHGEPRIPKRRAVSWARGPQHLPEPGDEPRRCRDCGRKIWINRRDGVDVGWRHAR